LLSDMRLRSKKIPTTSSVTHIIRSVSASAPKELANYNTEIFDKFIKVQKQEIHLREKNKKSRADLALRKYFQPWKREIQDLAKAEEAKLAKEGKKDVEPPKFIMGKAGEIAMDIWYRAYAHGGAIACARLQLELEVFTRFSNAPKETWKKLMNENDNAFQACIRSPNEFLSLDKKSRILVDLIQEIGGSEFFIFRVILPLSKSGELHRINQIYADYKELQRAFNREIDVVLFTNKALDQQAIDFYKASISLDFLAPEDKMIFDHKVDGNIWKGYKVSVQNKIHDFTHDKETFNQLTKGAKIEPLKEKQPEFKKIEEFNIEKFRELQSQLNKLYNE